MKQINHWRLIHEATTREKSALFMEGVVTVILLLMLNLALLVLIVPLSVTPDCVIGLYHQAVRRLGT